MKTIDKKFYLASFVMAYLSNSDSLMKNSSSRRIVIVGQSNLYNTYDRLSPFTEVSCYYLDDFGSKTPWNQQEVGQALCNVKKSCWFGPNTDCFIQSNMIIRYDSYHMLWCASSQFPLCIYGSVIGGKWCRKKVLVLNRRFKKINVDSRILFY